MTVETLGKRLAQLESRVHDVEERLPPTTAEKTPAQKHGWRWFVGIYADSPDFDEVVQTGREWRNASRPDDEETPD